MKRTTIGICRVCLQKKELTYEHYPPKSAFNKDTAFYSIDHHQYMENFKEFHREGKIRSRVYQGGLGDYCLCEQCKNFLGVNYVKDYVAFSKICYSLLAQNPTAKALGFNLEATEINLKNFIKQVTAIFICCNNVDFSSLHPELLDFIKDKHNSVLPKKFRYYLYLNDEGQVRNGVLNFTNLYGIICEFTFPPFGLVLNINNPLTLSGMAEITSFKDYDLFANHKLNFILNRYPSYTPIPLDFRTRQELD